MIRVIQHEHVVLVVGPVAGGLPQLLADHSRCPHLHEAACAPDLERPFLEGAPQRHAARMPERSGRRLGVEAEEVQVAAQLAVVALLRLLDPPQVLIELLLRLPDGAVDALEHRPLLVTAPVGARRMEQLERPDPPGRLEVRPAAQVVEAAVPVEADHRRLLVGELANDLGLVLLSRRRLLGNRLVAPDLGALEWQVGGDLLAHAGLDRLQVGRGQGARQVEVVVEAVADGGPDPQLGSGEQVEHGRRHDMRGRVAHRVEPIMGAGIQELGRRRSDLVAIDCQASSSSARQHAARCEG